MTPFRYRPFRANALEAFERLSCRLGFHATEWRESFPLRDGRELRCELGECARIGCRKRFRRWS